MRGVDNLWDQVGTQCLRIAKEELDKKTTPTEATVEMVERLVGIAISIDNLNLRWAQQNRFGAAAFADRPFSPQEAKN